MIRKQPNCAAQLNALVTTSEQSLDTTDALLAADQEKMEQERRLREELAAEAKRKEEEEAAELIRVQRAEVDRVRALQKEMDEIAGVGGMIHNPVRRLNYMII
jgi:hypothetical protein